MGILIRRAELSDLQSLFDLYEYWDEKEFHFKKKYTKEILKRIIVESEITVAVDYEKVVSFYLINPFFDIGNVKERKKIIPQLIADEQIPNGRYAFCLLSATHKDYLSRGLNRAALNLLCEIASYKYDYFIGIMYYGNIPTQKSSLKMGWKHYGDVGFGLLAIIGTTEENHKKLNDINGKL